ncbi:MAG: hypothetical protein QXP36_08235 [Conexivisphaerales archaeon]
MSEKLLWLGESKVPVKADRKTDLVMDSVINYYDSPSPSILYKAGKLFLDCGAFTARQQGIVLERNKVIEIQELFMPDKAVPLDFPFGPGMPVSLMARLWENTKENISYWQNSTKLQGKIVPVLHAWSKKSLVSNLMWLQREADADMIMLGSLVNPDFADFSGFFGDRQPRRELVDMLSLGIEAVRCHTNFKIHVTGLGSSPLTLHLAYYLGADSTDSAGYRRKAAYGKIILPGTGERYVSNRSASFGTAKIEDSLELMWLEKCNCPICSSNPSLLVNDWKARAIHNEHVIKQECQLARDLLEIGEDAYEAYLDRIFSRSGLNHLWEYAKLRKKYMRISQVLFGGK